jgi:hypothetical protein
MFYCQGGAPPNELWTVGDVLEALERIDEIANLSTWIKIVAPFAYDRANGIVAHPELRQAFDNLVAAAAAAGAATLTPIPSDPPIDPPKPPKPFRSHERKLTMEIDGKIVRLRGAGGKVIAPDAPGTGIWGTLDGKPSEWRGVLYVGQDSSAAKYRAHKLPSNRYTFTNVEAAALAGADAGQYSAGLDKQGYHKPTGNTDAGELEQWRVYDGNENGAIEAQVEQTTDENHPDGPGHKFFGFPLAVEVIS